MIIKTFTVGAFASNNYLVVCNKTKDAVLIDAGGDYNATIKELKSLQANLKYIFYTHAHLDHISGDFELKSKINVKTFLHKDDQFLVDKFKEQLFMFGMPQTETPLIDEYVEDGQILEVGALKFKVIHTPGHSPGSVSYLVNDVVFSGDTLFADSVGRTDLPGGSYEQLRDSIINKLFVLDDKIKVYPGHGESTTIGHEKQNNPFFGKKARI
ncbi:MAG TPA: MBL fold metallo-hydrolase [Candidatus Gastranaerophilales bacterium]|nr:MBL fold metallo-hydrolase [Candidatus Gastranaerophilales bacterium]